MTLDHRPQTVDGGRSCRPRSIVHRLTLSLLLVLLSGCQAGNRPAPSVTLALLGDVMLGRDVHPSAQTFAYLEPFLKSADLALANLESPLTNALPETESAYQLCAAPENARYLAGAGFDLLSLANNHRFDCGEKGLAETQSTLTEAGLGFIGSGPEPVYREINGIRLAFLAFDATSGFDPETAIKAVRSVRESGAIIVVSLHWGMEYQSGATSEQKQIAARLAEAGAALIWGQHPHVLQRAEWANNHKTLVLYSLGNALFDQGGLASTRQSALALVTLDKSGVTEMHAIPFVIDVPGSRLIEADPASAKTILGYFN
jgi:poly-gamma-glutamate capsule biosynthesis protein CapA/YwtB (metallophosphatase superfamily)